MIAIGALIGLSSLLLGDFSLAQSPASVGPWTFTGCVNETPSRSILGASFSAPNMTVEACTSFCSDNDYSIAGVEYADECYCGDVILNNATTGFGGCNMPCSGSFNQTCGGSLRLSVYTDTSFIPDIIVPNVGSFQEIGCFTEGATERTLPGALVTVSYNLTVSSCVGICSSNGYKFAGVEYEIECYCGNIISNQTSVAPDSECNLKCRGDQKTFCGGSDRINLYQDTASARRRH